MQRLLIALVTVLPLTLAPIMGAEIDPLRGSPALPCAPRTDGEDAPEHAKKVLWDTAHGVHSFYTPSGYHSMLVEILESELSLSVIESERGVLAEELHDYEVLVVSLGSAWLSSYTDEEVAAIRRFVEGGGGLLVLSDNCNCPNSHVAPVAEAFDIGAGTEPLYPRDLSVKELSDHPVTREIAEVRMAAAGEIKAGPPARIFARSKGRLLGAATALGHGRIVVLGDVNALTNELIVRADNELFSIGLFDWLRRPTPMERFEGLGGMIVFETPGASRFSLVLEVELGETSDGLDFDEESMLVSFGSFSEMLPPGACAEVPGGHSYTSPGPGLVEVSLLGDRLYLSGLLLDLDGSALPTDVVVTMGNDQGASAVRFVGHLSVPPGSP